MFHTVPSSVGLALEMSARDFIQMWQHMTTSLITMSVRCFKETRAVSSSRDKFIFETRCLKLSLSISLRHLVT